MGSSGSGNLSDYSGSKSNDGAGKSGGASGENKCQKAFSAMLEEVDRSSYFKTKKSVPPVGEKIDISFNKRPIAVSKDGLIIGYLPTKLNYIKMCLEDGYTYSGIVVSSSGGLVAAVSIDVEPTK